MLSCNLVELYTVVIIVELYFRLIDELMKQILNCLEKMPLHKKLSGKD